MCTYTTIYEFLNILYVQRRAPSFHEVLFPSKLAWTPYCRISGFHRNSGTNKPWCIKSIQAPVWLLTATVLMSKLHSGWEKFSVLLKSAPGKGLRFAIEEYLLTTRHFYLVPSLEPHHSLEGSYHHHSHLIAENRGLIVGILSKFRGIAPPAYLLQSPTCSKKVNLSEIRWECSKKVQQTCLQKGYADGQEAL